MKANKPDLRQLTLAGLMAALICILSPMSLPIGPVPISLATLAIYLTLYILDWRLAMTSVLTYILLGIAGLPVFAGFSGGLSKLAGPTGGYIAGYLLLPLIAGPVICRRTGRTAQLAAMISATAALYAFGTAWFCFVSGTPLHDALTKCVWIFIPGDLIKIVITMAVGPTIRHMVEKNKK